METQGFLIHAVFFFIITFDPNTLFLTFGCSMHVQLECLLSTFWHFEVNS